MLVGGDDPMGQFIRQNSGLGPANHTAYLDRASDGTLWVIDINPRPGEDMRYTPFEVWTSQYKFIDVVRQNDPQAGEAAVRYLKTDRQYGFNPATKTFSNNVTYNLWGAAFGGLPLLGALTRNNPTQQFCSELVCDTQRAIGKQLPGIPQDSWRTPNHLYWAVPHWGKNIREVKSSTQLGKDP